MTFETERCEHGIVWTSPCPVCIMAEMDRIKREREVEMERDRVRDLVSDDVPRFRWRRKGDLPGDID